ncbi:MAG: histidinol dehydrogenase [Desulfovibrionaceae bacterium]
MPLPTLRLPEDMGQLVERLASRRGMDPEMERRVRAILDDVRQRGDEALVEYTRRFDCPDFDAGQIVVERREIERAMDQVPPGDLDILAEAIANVRSFHQAQKRESWVRSEGDGTVLGQLVRPVEAAGLYVPGGAGGSTPLISSLIMTAAPAQIAGVPRITAVTPPRRDGSLNPYILATANLLGSVTVLRCGSAWAVAALAYGTQSVPACDVIAGPGNIYVTTAKRLLTGEIGIDMIAGPSEILILADDSAKPNQLAADLLSQAEHDTLASSLLITTSPELARDVREELLRQLGELDRAEMARASLQDYGAVLLASDLDTALAAVNRIAPEHLEIVLRDPWPLLGRIHNAGAIFLGPHAPEPVGDYFAGPNHVLPTLRNCRHASALGVDNFLKFSSLIATSEDYILKHGAKIARLARLEGLEAHARSVESRLKK